ncbi:hypothetical protein DL89DRAFT_321541 [Linderina pennispora]|uniref:BTB domain-containing protein n=1 Tax=Linderina pennispora TaxID=61395 RepID=A0A1Y1WCP9_9FUNG|nr:uncharacterized protein DL89DRAFT_321541 [Linderina pennispora]ORX71108.1 hypothetical protein DL89DRAFT_321541 [Linderina pennispora]
MSLGSNLQYVYRWRIGQWSSLAPCVEHNSPPFDADGLCWVFKLFKGRTRNPQALALYLAVHESSADRLRQMRKKLDISFTLENLQARSLSFNKYPAPITVWVDSNYSTWGDDKFIDLADMNSFLNDDTACLVVRFHVRETIHEGAPMSLPTSTIAVYVPDKIAAPFNQLLKSARFSDIQFELRDSSSLLLSPGPPAHGLLPSPRSSGEFVNPLGIDQCVTPMPGNRTPRALPYAHRPRMDEPPLPGHRYHAHKAILMQVSPVFEAMFSNGMRETFEQVVEVWDVTPRAFERLLEFAYTRQCDLDPKSPKSANVTPDEVVETLLCADQFGVTELRHVCWRNLMSKISIETVWEIWSIATDLEAKEQMSSCRMFCCRHFTQLCQNESTMWAPAHLLKEVLASDALNVQSEEDLFETVVRWAEFSEDDSGDEQQARATPPGQIVSAEKHTKTTRPSDSAVLKCYRSPANLALLPRSPRSPFLQARSPRRKSELTREAFTAGAMPGATTPPSTDSPRTSICNVRLQSVEYSDTATLATLHARKEHLSSLLPCIRFPMMDKQFLLTVVERNSELMAMPLMKDLLIEAYRFHAFNPPAPVEKPERRRASECFAKRESSTPVEQYAKIILPLNGTDEYTLSRSQRRKWVFQNAAQKTLAQNIFA